MQRFKLNVRSLRIGISLKMVENPVKFTSQGTYDQMECTFSTYSGFSLDFGLELAGFDYNTTFFLCIRWYSISPLKVGRMNWIHNAAAPGSETINVTLATVFNIIILHNKIIYCNQRHSYLDRIKFLREQKFSQRNFFQGCARKTQTCLMWTWLK